VEYEFVDVDLASAQDHEKIRDDIVKKGGEPNYPTIIVDNKTLIVGFRKDLLQKALEL
jgi:glutaredoxin